ncbi:MAG: 4Fe-4S binding protein [Candidatus Lokiarchaeota archaeon]|nr:4Fe-4S binding protein [Candidatus Lokiarchaeota archaeon]
MAQADQIYRNLQIHLNSMPVGFPSTESGADIKVLKAYFLPDEALLATYLEYNTISLKKIYSRTKNLGMTLEQTEQKLDSMVQKRIIYEVVNPRTNKKFYGNLPYAIGFFETHVNRLTKEMAEAFDEYDVPFIKEFLGEKTGIPQMRTVPINAAITHENNVMSYDNAREILENVKGPYAVAPCVCVQSRELIGKKCGHDMIERCMVNSQSYLDLGDARKITKAEALEILQKAEEKGLVIQPGNIKNAGGFCLCCGCCCGILSHAKLLEKPAELFATNYFSEVDEEKCTGCRICEDVCPMDAIIIINEVSHINRERCIGCGVCVSNCPSEAIHLRDKEEKITPPEDGADLIAKLIKKKIELK